MKTSYRKSAFTLIEILVVIAIIGILMGFLTLGIGQARAKARNMRLVAELKQVEMAIDRVRNELGGGDYPPDGTDYNDVMRFCRRAFPRAVFWDSTSNTAQPAGAVPFPTLLSPATALTFWLGGVRDPGSGTYLGFSANPVDPFDYYPIKNMTSGTSMPVFPSRKGPYYEFDKSRLVAVQWNATNKSPFNHYDGWELSVPSLTPAMGGEEPRGLALQVYFPQNDQVLPIVTTANQTQTLSPSPLLYFKAFTGKYSSVVNGAEVFHTWTQPSSPSPGKASSKVTAFKDARTPAPPGARAWMNPKSCQILCSGLDGFFGVSVQGHYFQDSGSPDAADSKGVFSPIYPDGANYDPDPVTKGKYTNDDITNFMQGSKLSDDMPQ